MKTKSLQNAKNYSNNSKHIIFESDMDNVVLGDIPFGAPDIDDVYHSIVDNSLENSIQDLMAISIGEVGNIVIRSEKNDPAGFAQVDQWNFSVTDDFVYDEDTTINILGIKVEMKKGYDIRNFVIETEKVINDYIAEGLYFKSLEKIDDTTLKVEYADRRIHDPIISIDEYRVDVEKIILRDVSFGYGQWIYLGSQEITFTIGKRTLHYYQRVG